jgi:two-component system copper resistance phosphate regulon response regulator CusR
LAHLRHRICRRDKERAPLNVRREEALEMKRILIIDDDPPIARLIGAALKAEGVEHAVEYCRDGAPGKIKAAQDEYDLITLDLNMPLMDGFEALEEMKSHARSADTPVVIVTAEDDAATHLRLRESGAAAVVTKPLSVEDLGALLGKALSGQPIEEGAGPAGDADLRGMGSAEPPNTPE